MTRLKTNDICDIPSRLEQYNQDLLVKTGQTLLGIACHARGVDEIKIQHQVKSFNIHVVPITAGQGIITDFSAIVTAILTFLGFDAHLADQVDITGIARSFENHANAIMMADDHKFVGINLNKGAVVDNSEATGRVFAAALDLMAKGIRGRDVLVLGCGPVGEAAAQTLLSLGGKLALFDTNLSAALSLKERLLRFRADQKIRIEPDVIKAIPRYGYLLEATPAKGTIPAKLIGEHQLVAAPGVPLGISPRGCQVLKHRLIHDKLELGVAAMAISLLA